MSFIFRPWQMLAAIFAGAMNQEQKQRMDFLCTELQVAKEAFGKRRMRQRKTTWSLFLKASATSPGLG